MPVHDWPRVKAGIFHDFHSVWLGALRTALNLGRLPPDYYAQMEQYADDAQADVLTLHESPPSAEPLPDPDAGGGVATVAAVKASSHLTATKETKRRPKQRHLVIRHVSGHRPVAFVEVVSPSNFDRRTSRAEFAEKVRANVAAGLHVTVINLFPARAGCRDLSALAWRAFDRVPVAMPPDKPLIFSAFVAKRRVEAYFDFLAVGDELPAFPLFLTPNRFVPLPLAETYDATFAGCPPYLRDLLSIAPAGDGTADAVP